MPNVYTKRGGFVVKNAKYYVLIIALLSLTMTTRLLAHCDSMDGPVIKDAQRALESNDVTPVLKWVSAKDEDAVEKVFELTTSTRGQSEAVQKIADNYFFETLVRIHRASEGEGFTGLKPKGSVEPAIAAADRALVEGDIDQLADKIAVQELSPGSTENLY
jgi:proline dehydrogenase